MALPMQCCILSAGGHTCKAFEPPIELANDLPIELAIDVLIDPPIQLATELPVQSPIKLPIAVANDIASELPS